MKRMNKVNEQNFHLTKILITLKMTEYEVEELGGKNGPRTEDSVSSMFFSCACNTQ